MSSPRIEIDLRKLRHNTRTIAARLKLRGIRVTAVTKAVCGHPPIARAMLEGGATGLAEARLRNVMRMRQTGLTCPVTLIRTPMLSQVDDVVQYCEASYNTETTVISALAAAARRQSTVHGVVLMVELGDQREGILPQDLGEMARHVLNTPGVALHGIGANFACLNGVAPTDAKMRALSAFARDVEVQCGLVLRTVSGGNSANLPWALGEMPTGRINDLRLGEAILLGVDPITGDQIGGMVRDAITLVAEVIETNAGPVPPLVNYADSNLARIWRVPEASKVTRIILGVGHQDTDPAGLSMPPGYTLIGATSDHLVVGAADLTLSVGSEMRFRMNYSAVMRAMAAPDIQKILHNDWPVAFAIRADGPGKCLALA